MGFFSKLFSGKTIPYDEDLIIETQQQQVKFEAEVKEALAKHEEQMKAPPILPNVALPDAFPGVLVDILDSKPLVFYVSCKQLKDSSITDWATAVGVYLGAFIGANASNPFIGISKCPMAKEDIEVAIKILFLFGVMENDKVWIESAQIFEVYYASSFGYDNDNVKVPEYLTFDERRAWIKTTNTAIYDENQKGIALWKRKLEESIKSLQNKEKK